MTYKEKVAWLQRYLKAREKANFLGGCVQEMEAEAQGMRTRLDGMPGAGWDTARLARSVEKVEETRKMWNDQLDRWRRAAHRAGGRAGEDPASAGTGGAAPPLHERRKLRPEISTRWPWWSAAFTSCIRLGVNKVCERRTEGERNSVRFQRDFIAKYN